MERANGAADGESGSQDRAREGLEHLQAAARELIEAARAILDVAEDVVNDPEAVASAVTGLGALGDLVRSRAGSAQWGRPAGGDGVGDGPAADPGDRTDGEGAVDGEVVERITVL
jgi:hypothetical protein